MKFAPSSTAIRRAIFLISFSEKPTVRSAFRSWQMPKKSMFGFIRISPMHKAGTVFHGGIRFPRFLTFVLLALFVATSQANGRFQTAAAGCRSTGLAPLRGSLRAAPITFRCGWAGVPLSADEIIARQLAKAAFGWMGTARHLIGPSLCRSIAPAQVVFAHPPNRFPSSGSAN